VRELELVTHPLLPAVALNQPGVLHRRADLVRHRGHQLAVAQREAITAEAIGEVDDAHAAERGPRRPVADGHAEKRVPAIAARLAAVGGHHVRRGRVVRHDAALAVDPRGHGGVVVHPHRHQTVEPEAARGHRAENGRVLVVHHDGGPPGAHDRAHFVRDDLGGFLELDGLAEDLADRVQQVDLLVPAGQLLGEEAPLALCHEQCPDDRQQRGGGRREPGLGQRADLEPEALDLVDGLEPDRPRGGVDRTRRARDFRGAARIRARGEAQRAPVVPPQAHSPPDERAQAVDD
jgi:hypothetical protein